MKLYIEIQLDKIPEKCEDCKFVGDFKVCKWENLRPPTCPLRTEDQIVKEHFSASHEIDTGDIYKDDQPVYETMKDMFGGSCKHCKWDCLSKDTHVCPVVGLPEKMRRPTRDEEQFLNDHLDEVTGPTYPSHCCQKCGESIGWIGRYLFFGKLHRCKK